MYSWLKMTGKAYIVGSGPGDPKLLTLRAFEVIKNADIVIHDKLVTKDILRLIPSSIKKICKEEYNQRHLNDLIISETRLGKNVVRLKGGDPFIFGRGGEEAEALRENQIEFEIVPGLTSAFAIPAYSGIPLTDRRYSSSIAIVTGHEDPSKKNSVINWSKLASSVEVIVILMGVSRLKEISEELLRGGLKERTPIAAIEWGTTENQKTILFTLGEVAKDEINFSLNHPSVIVIGEIVNFATQLDWFPKNKILTSLKFKGEIQ